MRQYLEEASNARPDGWDIWVQRVLPQQDPDTPSNRPKADHIRDEQPQPAPQCRKPLNQQVSASSRPCTVLAETCSPDLAPADLPP